MSTHDNYHESTCTYLGEGVLDLSKACGRPSITGKSYCCDHVWLVYQEGSSVKPRRKKERAQHSLQDLIDDFNAAVDELALEDDI